jgi:Protein of unknown function (DUF3309)
MDKDQMLMEGVTMELGRRPLQLHVRCFQIWDHERRVTARHLVIEARLQAREICSARAPGLRRNAMPITTILIIILVLIVIGALPTWPYSSGWGYYPSGGLGLILIILIVLALTGRL